MRLATYRGTTVLDALIIDLQFHPPPPPPIAPSPVEGPPCGYPHPTDGVSPLVVAHGGQINVDANANEHFVLQGLQRFNKNLQFHRCRSAFRNTSSKLGS